MVVNVHLVTFWENDLFEQSNQSGMDNEMSSYRIFKHILWVILSYTLNTDLSVFQLMSNIVFALPRHNKDGM